MTEYDMVHQHYNPYVMLLSEWTPWVCKLQCIVIFRLRYDFCFSAHIRNSNLYIMSYIIPYLKYHMRVVWCSAVWYGVVWCGVWCGVVWSSPDENNLILSSLI